MRSLRSPAWARSTAFAAALLIAIAGFAPGAAAQEKYNQLFVFGDSYADLTLSDMPAGNLHAPPNVALNLWRVYPIALQDNLGIPNVLDFAVGGATTLSLPIQVDQFLSTGQLLGSRDLITLNIGGNDAIGFVQGGGTVATAPIAAQITAANAVAQIDRLVDAGAQTFVFAAFSGLSGLPIVPAPVHDVADAFGAAYFAELQKQLLPSAQAGTRYFLLDLFALGKQVEANLGRYGLEGVQCPFTGSIVCGNSINSPDQNKYFIGPDGLHLTNRGFEIVGAYMANIVMAPDTIAVQPNIVKATTSGFTSTLLDRLGGARQLTAVAGITVSGDDGGAMGLGRKSRTDPPSRVTTFALGSLFGGNRGETTDLAGYEYDATAGTAGIEYSVNRNLVVGLAGNYTTTNADLTSGAHINLDAVQMAAYWSYATRSMFADVLAGIGSHDLGLVRPGVIDPVRGETDALTFAVAVRGGYLFDLGKVRAGPIAGLSYIHARVDGYTEKGDPLLTYDVASQTFDSLTGHIGLRLLAPFKVGDSLVIPHVNITLEHQLGDNARVLTATLTQAPLLPILTSIANFDDRTYGKLEGGITLHLNSGLGATISGSSTFTSDEARDFTFNAGLSFKF
jgi:uncharacterized protein YhjY with autotransporter beta-barrel domain/phospholipase/lecithinase/hemolysin